MNILSKEVQLEHYRKIAEKALKHYTIEGAYHLEFIAISQNVTYQVNSESGERYLLRLNRSDDFGAREIISELIWLETLGETDVVAPRGVRNQLGEFVTEVVDGAETHCCTLMGWVEGEFLEEPEDADVLKMGALMGMLHNHASQFKPGDDFTRPAWGGESLQRHFECLKLHYDKFMNAEELTIYQTMIHHLTELFLKLPKTSDNYGIIHADFHSGNILFEQGEPRPIDFGGCGFGFYYHDIAQAMLELVPAQRKIFIEGYLSQRKLPEDFQCLLERFFIMACIENACFHAPNSDEWENLKRQVPFVCKLINFKMSGDEFLFGVKR